MYVLIENNKIIKQVAGLPKAYKNVSGFNMLDAPMQVTYGWYNAIMNKPTLDNDTQVYSEPVITLVDTTATIDYSVVEISLDEAKNNAIRTVTEDFIKQTLRPIISFTLSSTDVVNIQGGREDLQNYEGALAINSAVIVAEDNEPYNVTAEDWVAIILAIRLNGESLYQAKWAKRAAILAAEDNQQIRDALAL